ncbi:S1/P1 nuclease [bacterium]|nr:S1/P1 nuclease [bacterium]
MGHRSVALIAQDLLTPAALNAVAELLPNTTMADVAMWADSLKSTDGYKNEAWLHFEKMEDGVPYLKHLAELPDWQVQKGGAIMAILVAVDNLQNLQISKEKKHDALKFLIHFVGDIHQPLHTGRPIDKGGVTIDVSWFGTPMSLHRVWDSGMMASAHPDLITPTQTLPESAVQFSKYLVNKYQSQPVVENFDLHSWLKESLSLRTPAYDPFYETDQNKYMQMHISTIEKRIYEAGVRLAEILNIIYLNKPIPADVVLFRNDIESVVGDIHQIVEL